MQEGMRKARTCVSATVLLEAKLGWFPVLRLAAHRRIEGSLLSARACASQHIPSSRLARHQRCIQRTCAALSK
jgi:hypothetical protein